MSDGVPRHIGRSPYSTSSISYMYIVRMDRLWIGEDWHSIGEGLMCHRLVLDWIGASAVGFMNWSTIGRQVRD